MRNRLRLTRNLIIGVVLFITYSTDNNYVGTSNKLVECGNIECNIDRSQYNKDTKKVTINLISDAIIFASKGVTHFRVEGLLYKLIRIESFNSCVRFEGELVI